MLKELIQKQLVCTRVMEKRIITIFKKDNLRLKTFFYLRWSFYYEGLEEWNMGDFFFFYRILLNQN